MTYIAVTYDYVDDPARLDQVRPQHREVLGRLYEAGTILLSGPWTEGPGGALLLVRADSPEAALTMLDQDPFQQAGLIASRTARAWKQVYGPLD